MLDDLRSSAEDSYTHSEPKVTTRPKKKKLFLGMTSAQRFVVALFLLIIVVVLGTFCLLATGKIVLP